MYYVFPPMAGAPQHNGISVEQGLWSLLVKESYRAQNSMQNKELSHSKKKMDVRLIMPSSQPVQPLADLQNSLPQPFKR